MAKGLPGLPNQFSYTLETIAALTNYIQYSEVSTIKTKTGSMRGSRMFCQRGLTSDNVFSLFCFL